MIRGEKGDKGTEKEMPTVQAMADDREYIVLNRREEETTPEDGTTVHGQPDQAAGETKKEPDYAGLDSYEYFDGNALYRSMHTLQAVSRSAEELAESGQVKLEKMQVGYMDGRNEVVADVTGQGRESGHVFPMRLVLSRDKVLYGECGCRACRKHYYSFYYRKEYCACLAALMRLTQAYIKGKNLGDATDRRAQLLFQSFAEQRANSLLSDSGRREQTLSLQPRMISRKGELSVSFRVGAGRLFVIKNLFEFYSGVQESSIMTFGSGTQLNLGRSNFTENDRKWIDYVGRIVREEQAFETRLINSGNYNKRALSKTGEFSVSGWRLDELYDLLGTDGIEFENKETGEKGILHGKEQNPRVTMTIRKNAISSRHVFHGVTVECNMPFFYYGVRTAYYIGEGALCRIQEEFLERIRLLAEVGQSGSFSFQVGRNYLTEFYHNVLPRLEGFVDIVEEQLDDLENYLLPQAEFVFYLDAEQGNMSCRIAARYGERQVSVLDLLEEEKDFEHFRDVMREQEILFLTQQWFPCYDPERKEIHCGGEEEKMYQVLNGGVDALLGLGEVQCTKRFGGMHVNRRLQVRVGVSVSHNLLDLQIATEDIPPEELLDILKSYRMKKKYHRLKNGDFLSMEDASLETLQEMTAALRMSPKDLLGGTVRLPLYRALYLERLLEQNEEVYAKRDSRFRELARNFNTVKDADFEVPAPLEKVLRGYQKTGYRWLRLLDAYGFGGILADDMGLGKTVQAIAVLLAAKLEGRQGTALIVAPASLVYNWGEELRRFAPQLSWEIIAGSQEERAEKLKDCGKYDVIVTSYDLLKRDIALYEDLEFYCQIIDEAQYIKNHTTAAAKAVKGIKSGTRYALTGTPVENGLGELWSIFDFLMPGYLYGYEVFRKELEAPIVRDENDAALLRLQRMTSPFILRRLKEDVLKDLPEKLEESRYVRLEDAQRRLYDAQVVQIRQTLCSQGAEEFRQNKIQILAELTKLRQICCDPALCFENYEGGSAKLDACMDLVQNAVEGGHRILLFSQFTTMLERIGRRLEQAGFAYYTITGATPKEKRLQLVKDFNGGEVPVFLISLKAGGVGLNLTGADVVIHYDPWWNLAAQNQATDRTHRIGQTKKVVVYQLIAMETVEKKIQELQESKRLLAEQVVRGDADSLGSMSREDFLELLSAK